MRGLSAFMVAFVAASALAGAPAVGQPSDSPSPAPSPSSSPAPQPTHPQINWLNRDQEDWSVLADPALRTDPFDSLKYIPLGGGPQHYLSLGLTVRELGEWQTSEVTNFIPPPGTAYLLSRLQVDADLHLGDTVRVFTQLAGDFAPWKQPVTPVDQDPLALEQGFLQLHFPSLRGALEFKIGRQEMAFDNQRFVAVREGPNVRQPFDAVWSGYQSGLLKLQGFYAQPVQTQIQRLFGDSSSPQQTFSGIHAEYGTPAGLVSGYVAQFYNMQSSYLFASGIERRNVFDLRHAGSRNGYDWDLEWMYQTGNVGVKVVRAWAGGDRFGYTWRTPHWSPRLGIQFDTASGDHDPSGNVIAIFNPLFPNGEYINLAGYPGYANFWHVKPSLTLHPTRTAQMTFALADVWRQSIADAVYLFPAIPAANTAGYGSSYTGTYQEFRLDAGITPHVIGSFEFDHFINAAWMAQAGAHNGNFVALDFEFGF